VTYISPAMIVEKKQGGFRVTHNLSFLNSWTKSQIKHNERIDHTVRWAAQWSYLSKIDLSKAFHSMTVPTEFRHFLGFSINHRTSHPWELSRSIVLKLYLILPSSVGEQRGSTRVLNGQLASAVSILPKNFTADKPLSEALQRVMRRSTNIIWANCKCRGKNTHLLKHLCCGHQKSIPNREWI